ncbi:MAG: MFS transporter [Verrucomicrobia bacterium]|nr:MFS transporter [Verrucomicrobiota bacterium]
MKTPTPDSQEAKAEAGAPEPADREARRLSEITPQQWRSGIAAWLGWLFDGLDMHLYTLVAAPYVAQLLGAATTADTDVKRSSSYIQAAFLIGWALGGGLFGRLGDRLGRSRVLALTILTYALFTGLSSVAQTWWQLLVFRFMAALGIGGEWAVGSSLLAETWPRRWRPWIAAVLQTGVNIGVLLACLTVFLMADRNPRYVFLVGILPALIVFWIRRAVPEPEEWEQARRQARERAPGIRELFRGPTRGLTLKTIAVCALSLTGWWAFMFWNPQHLRNLPELASWPAADRERLVSAAFFLVIAVSMAGNFFGGALAKWLGYRRAIAIMFLMFFGSIFGSYGVARSHVGLLFWLPWVGFSSGVFGLFTMYLPPLFPTLLRTTGAGFCFNIGRVAAAFGTVFFGLFSQVGDFRRALWYASFLFPAAMLVALRMPEAGREGAGRRPAPRKPDAG